VVADRRRTCEKSLRFTYDEFARFLLTKRILTLECISNSVGGRFIGNAKWTGTLMNRSLNVPDSPRREIRCLYAAKATPRHPSPLRRSRQFPRYNINGEPLPRRTVSIARADARPLRHEKCPSGSRASNSWTRNISATGNARVGRTPATQTQGIIGRSPQSFSNHRRHVRRHRYAIGDTSGISKVEISTDGGSHWQEVEIFRTQLRRSPSGNLFEKRAAEGKTNMKEPAPARRRGKTCNLRSIAANGPPRCHRLPH